MNIYDEEKKQWKITAFNIERTDHNITHVFIAVSHITHIILRGVVDVVLDMNDERDQERWKKAEHCISNSSELYSLKYFNEIQEIQ